MIFMCSFLVIGVIHFSYIKGKDELIFLDIENFDFYGKDRNVFLFCSEGRIGMKALWYWFFIFVFETYFYFLKHVLLNKIKEIFFFSQKIGFSKHIVLEIVF